MPLHELQSRLIKRAIQITGNAKQLCRQLGVNEHALQLWLDGRATAPGPVFQALIDLVLQDDLARAAQDRRSRPRSLGAPQKSEEGPA
jgi:transposase-like protein